MRALIAYAVASTLLVAGLTVGLVNATHRIAVLEQQLAPATNVAAASAPTTKRSRTFTSSSGYVLSAADLDRIDADRTAEKAAAELEYYVTTRRSRK